MNEISLHIFDLLENSIRAGAGIISISITENTDKDYISILIEDNGRGLKAGPDKVMDPFYTTKKEKRIGLGLSLFRAAAEQAGGYLNLRESKPGGLCIEVNMRLSHINRVPMGNLAETISAVILTNPRLELRLIYWVNKKVFKIETLKMFREIDQTQEQFALAELVKKRINSGLVKIGSKA
ncbi:MAG: ATP-binding protein [Candidatus Omnitrophica bacterium]|nr:ATP-binding protein [Candidatus Omnitrophota bacterium]